MEVLAPARRPLRGSVHVPGDKSLSHRALLLGAWAHGPTRIEGLLAAEDVAATRAALGACGVPIAQAGAITTVAGQGGRLAMPVAPLDAHNAGTCLRLLAGLLVAANAPATLTGDASLCRRPMGRLLEVLTALGGRVRATGGKFAPLTLERHGGLSLGPLCLPVPSAQLASAALLAALGGRGTLHLSGLGGARDHTQRMLRAFGARVTEHRGEGGKEGESGDAACSFEGGQPLTGRRLRIAGDPSSAAFWLAAATLVPGSDLALPDVCLNPARLGFVRVLRRMGARIDVAPRDLSATAGDADADADAAKASAHANLGAHAASNRAPAVLAGTGGDDPFGGEPVGTLRVRATPALRACTVSAEEVPALIDELPLLAVLATAAHGTTEVRGAAQLRIKESDRIDAIGRGLTAMGARYTPLADGFRVQGPTPLGPAALDSFGDHRIAMALAVAALTASGSSPLRDAGCASISYPNFWTAWQRATA